MATFPIREGNVRAGFRAIGQQCESLQAAIEKLHRDGHLGQRKCIVSANFAPLVYKGGKTRRVWQGDLVGARVEKGLGDKSSGHAWLEVPDGMVDEAEKIVAAL